MKKTSKWQCPLNRLHRRPTKLAPSDEPMVRILDASDGMGGVVLQRTVAPDDPTV
jgi:hypothetical protein